MSICSSEIITISSTYDCVKICGTVKPAPVVDYEIDIENFLINAQPISSTGTVMYKWRILSNGYELYNSGYGLEGDALPQIANSSVYEKLMFGNNYVDLINMLNNIAPFYRGMELNFELTIKDESGKESENVNTFILTL